MFSLYLETNSTLDSYLSKQKNKISFVSLLVGRVNVERHYLADSYFAFTNRCHDIF